MRVDYQPESHSGLFGGNSNWRGPIWFPVNMLIVRGLLTYYLIYGDDLNSSAQVGSDPQMTLLQMSQEITRRLCSIFLRHEAHEGRRPVFGSGEKFQRDPLWRDNILFHGDTGAGLGTSHQTGLTGLIGRLPQLSVRPRRPKELTDQHA